MTGEGICRMSDRRPRTLEDKVDIGVHPAVAMMRLDGMTKCPKPDLAKLCSLGIGAAGVLSPAATVAAMSLNGDITKKGKMKSKKDTVKKKKKKKKEKPKKKKKKKDKKSGKKKGKDKSSSSSTSSSEASGAASVITLGSSDGESEAVVCEDTIL
mmetsp:Transcript_23730/g.64561  ORF Transcript_23730/g.64561 Transcript_23730/m.64561 type:complete len:155 (-) Transcript_23730:24-488(-)